MFPYVNNERQVARRTGQDKANKSIVNSSYSFLQLTLTVVFTIALLLSNIIVNKQISLPQVLAKILLEAVLLPVTAAVTKAVKTDDERRRKIISV